MDELRDRWTGVSLPGDYLLQQWLSGDDAAAFFETSLPPDGRLAVVKLVPASTVDAAAQLALWRRTRSLRHPNLLQLLDCGRAELSGEIAVYAVFEYADDSLARALAQAPLSEAEAREVLDAVLPALAYLQAHGLALPVLDPDQVLGVGDAIKLSTGALREAGAGTPYTAQLRAFWSRISPFPLSRGSEILAQALGASPQAGPPPPSPHASRPFPKWPLLAAAAVVLLILSFNLRTAPEPPAQPLPAPTAPQKGITSPEDSKPSPVGQAMSAPAAPAALWRVIASTFPTNGEADAMAAQINQQHPDLQAAVFTPPDKKGYFLVALSGPMSREDALRLQAKARAQGLSRAVYIKRFRD